MMNKESFWDAVERKQGSIEPFFKLLLGQRNVSTFLTFASLTDEDIKELCEDAQNSKIILTFDEYFQTQESFLEIEKCFSNAFSGQRFKC